MTTTDADALPRAGDRRRLARGFLIGLRIVLGQATRPALSFLSSSRG